MTRLLSEPYHITITLILTFIKLSNAVCRDVGLLDDEAQGPYMLIQLVLLLRVLAAASDARTDDGVAGIRLQVSSIYVLS